MKTIFVAPYVPSALNTINLAALYFDEIVLHERWLIEVECEPGGFGAFAQRQRAGRVRRLIPAIDDTLRAVIKPLIDENVVRIDATPPEFLLKSAQRERLCEAFFQMEDLLYRSTEGDPAAVSFDLVESGIGEIHSRLVEPLKVGGRFHFQAVSTYYEGLFVEAIDAALRGQAVLSSSPVLYQMIERAVSASALKSPRMEEVFAGYVQPRLAMDILNTTLIDSSTLDCSDVLEARYQLRNELAAFRAEIRKLQFDFTREFGLDKVFREGRAIADARLTPRVREIEGKVRTGRIRALRRLTEALEKPGAYVPLVGSVFAGVPLEIALALSVGLVSARVALETWEEHKQVANDGLFYLVKMKELLKDPNELSKSDARASVDHTRRSDPDCFFAWPEDLAVIPDESNSG